MVAAARYIKKNEPDAKVVFIGPCTAKKSEAVRLGVSDAVDYVLTFEELLALFEAFNVNPFECEEENVNDASVFGRNFGASGQLLLLKIILLIVVLMKLNLNQYQHQDLTVRKL